jgi:hypothetical protein
VQRIAVAFTNNVVVLYLFTTLPQNNDQDGMLHISTSRSPYPRIYVHSRNSRIVRSEFCIEAVRLIHKAAVLANKLLGVLSNLAKFSFLCVLLDGHREERFSVLPVSGVNRRKGRETAVVLVWLLRLLAAFGMCQFNFEKLYWR